MHSVELMEEDLEELTNLTETSSKAPKFGQNGKFLLLKALEDIKDDFEFDTETLSPDPIPTESTSRPVKRKGPPLVTLPRHIELTNCPIPSLVSLLRPAWCRWRTAGTDSCTRTSIYPVQEQSESSKSMSTIRSVYLDWKIPIAVVEKDGFVFERKISQSDCRQLNL